MTDTTHDTEWTPERRKERERERAIALKLGGVFTGLATARKVTDEQVRAAVDAAFPPPPPEYTYGPEVKWSDVLLPIQRRSDGVWGWWYNEQWYTGGTTDAMVRALAACVQLSDAECDALIVSHWPDVTQRRDRVRAAFARVMRGEVAHG